MEAGVTGDHLGGRLLQGEDSKNVSAWWYVWFVKVFKRSSTHPNTEYLFHGTSLRRHAFHCSSLCSLHVSPHLGNIFETNNYLVAKRSAQ